MGFWVFFFSNFKLGNIFENFDQKVPKNAKKVIFWQKSCFLTFLVENFQKYCLIQKFEKKKKKVPRMCLNMIFKQF